MSRLAGPANASTPDEVGKLRETILLADTLLIEGAVAEALVVLESARAIPGRAVDRYALGEALLRASNARLGWDLYDLHPSRRQDQLSGISRWDGRFCECLVLVAEQGFGDVIQFLRFVPHVMERAARVVVAVHDELLEVVSSSPLLTGVQLVSKSAARKTRWPAEARWERLMSLPVHLDAPRAEPTAGYLRAPAPTPSSQLPPAPAGCITIGVAWRSTRRRGFASRSFPVHLVSTLAASGQTRLVALHRSKDIKTAPDGVMIVDIHDFADTASVMAQCDYIVTADTVTAHLAPALGVPTLICLRNHPDWRWGAAANPTCWYASAELLFQEPTQRWEPVLSAAALHIFRARGLA